MKLNITGKSIAIVQGFLGAAGSAGLLEELIAMGFKKFIVCGAAGVLQKGIQAGHLVVPYSAVRDEGVSYHYAEPSREIECNQHAVNIIEKLLQDENIPYIKAKTWTTDAFYRETEDKNCTPSFRGVYYSGNGSRRIFCSINIPQCNIRSNIIWR